MRRGRVRPLHVVMAAIPLLLVASLVANPGLRSLSATIGAPTSAEQALWNRALAQDSCDGLRAYLRTYPLGAYAGEAKSRLEGRRTKVTLGPERDERHTWLVNPRRSLPTEEAARSDARRRGDQDAATNCKSLATGNFIQLLKAWVEPHDWKCDARTDGFTCGFDGQIVCRVRDRIRSERCR